jgi:hypothetical protein
MRKGSRPQRFHRLIPHLSELLAGHVGECVRFLAAFAAGVGLRSAEVSVQKRHSEEEDHDLPAEMQVNPHTRHALEERNPIKQVGLVIGDALSFGDTVERLLAATLVIVLGVTFALHWDATALMLALIIFVVVRPLAVFILTWRAKNRCFIG